MINQKKRRGGKRIRKLKQKYEMTELRKQANRVSFGEAAQQEYRDTGKVLGMIGVATGKVRLAAVDKGILKKQKLNKGGATPGGRTTAGMTSGISTSLDPVHGLELANPQKEKQAQEKYFGATTFKF